MKDIHFDLHNSRLIHFDLGTSYELFQAFICVNKTQMNLYRDVYKTVRLVGPRMSKSKIATLYMWPKVLSKVLIGSF